MPINVNCTSFGSGGDCLHQAAPRRWFGPAKCIVWLDEMGVNNDPRVRTSCTLCTPRPNPKSPPEDLDQIEVWGEKIDRMGKVKT